ncbi:MAG: murein biosynthesis integral membrane protein MurJ [Deltaproteobacteria bacterium]|nr:murein biosynthesis integral membrane protein MurJ [Deltaproteobacteria bacterium]
MTETTARRVGFAALLLVASQLLSRVLGFVRESVIAALVGRGRATDAYNAAFQIPDLLFYFLAGGALSIAFIPLYSRAKSEQGDAAAQRFLATVLGTMTALALAASVLLWTFADAFVALQFPRFEPEAQALTVRLTRIVLPAQIFFIAGGIVRGALMAEGRFGSQAAAPIVYNLGIIACGAVGARELGIEGFAWGALFGAAAGSLGTALYEARGRIALGFRFAPLDPEFRRYLVVALPLMLGVTLITVDEWYDRYFGGLLAVGSIATLAFARRLMQLPVGLVGQAVATAALPTFSKLLEDGRKDELDRLVLRTLQASTAIAVLLGVGTAALSDALVRAVYVRGEFALGDAAPVATALQLFCLGVPAWVVQTVAVRPFYARADMWRPMLLGTAFVVVAFPLYAWLGREQGAAGLALAGALAITANAVATLVVARRLHGAPRLLPLLGTLVRAIAASLPTAALAWLVADIAGTRSGLGTTPRALLELAVGGVVYAALALPLLHALGDEPTRDVFARVRARIRRKG